MENLQVEPGVENPPFLDHFSERETMGFPYLFTVYRRVYKFGRIIHWNQQKNNKPTEHTAFISDVGGTWGMLQRCIHIILDGEFRYEPTIVGILWLS